MTTLATSSTMVRSASPEPWLPWQYLVGSCNPTNPNLLIRTVFFPARSTYIQKWCRRAVDPTGDVRLVPTSTIGIGWPARINDAPVAVVKRCAYNYLKSATKKTNASAFDYDSNAQPLHLNSELYTPHKGPTSGLCNIYTVWGFCTSNGLNGGMSSRGWKLGAKFATGGVTARGKIVSLLTMYEIIFLGGVAVWTCSVCRWSAQEKNQSSG